jgi:hypothetical protein
MTWCVQGLLHSRAHLTCTVCVCVCVDTCATMTVECGPAQVHAYGLTHQADKDMNLEQGKDSMMMRHDSRR